MKQLVFIILFFSGSLFAQYGVVINEAVNNPFSSVEDDSGEYYSWIELYNDGNNIEILQQFYLSTAVNNLKFFRLPVNIIFPGEHMVIVFSGKSGAFQRDGVRFIHAGFEWSQLQQRMYLSDDTSVVDMIEVPVMPEDISYGSIIDGESIRGAFENPTPGYSNNVSILYSPRTESLAVWPLSGFYQVDSVKVEMQCTKPNIEIRYTLDGSTPSMSSPLYTAPFWISPQPTDLFIYAGIPTNGDSTHRFWRWIEPETMPDRNEVLTACAFENGLPITPLYYRHFFLQRDRHKHDVGVVSIITNPDNLFDYEKGIYIPGKVYDNLDQTDNDLSKGNYSMRGRQWERPANFALFEADGSLSLEQNIGIRIHGAISRSFALKSLRLYARKMYGNSTLNYSFFPEKDVDHYKRILMRNSGQDFAKTMFRDALVSELAAPLDLERQSSRPVVHYINGEYWGILNFRNRLDERFFAYTQDVSEEDVVIGRITFQERYGGDSRWKQFVLMLEETENMNTSTMFDSISAQVDVQNFIDYFLTRIFVGVNDWPGNNRMIWRTNDENSKFRNVLFDCDDALDNVRRNTLLHIMDVSIGENWPNPRWSTVVIRKFMENDIFREMFINRNEELMNTVFQPVRLENEYRKMLEMYEPLMHDHILRWQFPGTSMTSWNYYTNHMHAFLKNRHCHIRKHFIDYFDLSPTYMYGYDCDSSFYYREGANDFIQAFPNPTEGELHLGFKLSHPQNIKVTIYNSLGKMLYEKQTMLRWEYDVITIGEMANFAPGHYIVIVEAEEKQGHIKILKN